MPRKLIAALLLLIAAVCLTVFGIDLAHSLGMRRWLVTEGKVVYSDVREEKGEPRSRYYSDIRVRYQADGREFTTSSIRADSALNSADRSWADRIAQHYPRGATVEVHYRPENPAEARIETWPEAGIWVLGVWGLCALFAGVWILRRNPHT